MRKFTFLALLLCTFTLTSCIETLEEIFVNKDGSGEYSLTVDMSGLFSNPMMKAMMEQAAEEEGLDSTGMDLGETDTLFMMGEGEDILSRTAMHMVMSDSMGKFFFNMTFPFEDLSEIDEFSKALAEQAAENEEEGEEGALAGSPMGGGMAAFTGSGGLSLNKRTLKRAPAPPVDKEASTDEDMEMMKMFMGEATYTTIYHLPGEVKSTTFEGATVDGKVVTVEHSLIDVMEGNAKVEGEVVFKKK